MPDQQTDGTRASRGGLNIKAKVFRPDWLARIGHERNYPTRQIADGFAGAGERCLHLDPAAVLRRGVLGGDPGHPLCATAGPAASEVRLATQPHVAVHIEHLPGDCDSAGDRHQCLAGSGRRVTLQKRRERRTRHCRVCVAVQAQPAAVFPASAGSLRHGRVERAARENRQERDDRRAGAGL
ncbi:hypothetical protein D3C80_1247050 [compost metagenome]